MGGTLTIVAGDMNTTKGTQGWWNDALDFGFRDPIVKSGHGFGGARTTSKEMTGLSGSLKYSDHRALTATVKY